MTRDEALKIVEVAAIQDVEKRRPLLAKLMEEAGLNPWRDLASKFVGRAQGILEGYEQGMRDAAKVPNVWAESKSCDSHDSHPCCHVRMGAGIRDKILAQLEKKPEQASSEEVDAGFKKAVDEFGTALRDLGGEKGK